jgi:hypothetical protein
MAAVLRYIYTQPRKSHIEFTTRAITRRAGIDDLGVRGGEFDRSPGEVS